MVQLTGALSRPDIDESSVEMVRDIARTSRVPAFFFYAPMILPDAATAQALLTQPEVARAVSKYPQLTKAVVGVGAWKEGQSTMADAVTERLIAIDASQLQAVPEVIAIVYGASKARAVRAAIVGGFVTSLVTHDAMARELLALA